VKYLVKIKEKIDKDALKLTIVLLLMSWAALPAIYWLIVKNKKKEEKEVKENESMGQIR